MHFVSYVYERVVIFAITSLQSVGTNRRSLQSNLHLSALMGDVVKLSIVYMTS